MGDEWVRPYAPGSGRWVVIGWEAASLAAFGWTTIRLFDLGRPAAAATVAVLVAAWLTGSWRIVRMGVYVSDQGVRIRGLLRSRTVGWQQIAQIWLHRSSHRIGRWEIPSGLTVLLQRRNGTVVNTELWAQGVDFHSRPNAFRAVYQELRRRHRAAVRAAA